MSLINISDLTFCYDGSYDNIFENVSFQLDTSWKLGFCGRNGRGKTTFMNLLLGKFEYHGKISASVEFEYFPYNVEDPSKNTIDIINEISPDSQLWEIEKELSLLRVNTDCLQRAFSTLSNGEQTKCLLVALFLTGNKFLLIDEPTNHLDMEARAIVARYLNSKQGFILVSHDRLFLDECTDHTLSINKNNIEVVSGNFSVWWKEKKRQDAFELAENERLQADIKRLKQAAKMRNEWVGKAEKSLKKKNNTKVAEHEDINTADQSRLIAKTAKLQHNIERRQNRALEEKSKLLKNIETSDTLKMLPLEYHKKQLLFLDDISVFYGEKQACEDVSFEILQGERVALCGGNGSGKSSLLKLICGEKLDYKGNINIGSKLKISYVPQDASYLTGTLESFIREHSLDESLFKAVLRKLDFSRLQFEKIINDYSAGQKKKVLLAKSLCERAHLYVWDEPLNYIDVLSRISIEELIREFKPTLLFVEHDRIFCENISTKTIQLNPKFS